MAQQTLLGGDGTTGENGATHNTKANANFTELYGATAAAQADADAANSALSTHISDSSAAHAGSAIAFTPAGGISSTNVQAAIEEVAAASGVADASVTVKGIIEIATPAEVITGTDTERAVTAEGVHGKVVGIQDLYVPATAMWPRITGACGPIQQYEMATSLVNVMALPFDQTTQEYAQFTIEFARKYNLGTITAVPKWTATAGSGTVRWTVRGGAYSNDDALTVALGTAQNSDDTLLATNDMHTGPETPAITLSGTPASTDFLVIEVSRDVANDTLTGDALLLGVTLRITTTAAKDA